ncbi:MAG: ATPase, partial [Verrucomicrobia bacterium]|nr:ATPase [Verrucomicrobiota bacterium]
RSWHNERALDPSGPWAGLTLSIAYATEAHLFISDMNQSPFNVGTRLSLEDFAIDQIKELDNRYGNPLKSDEEVQQFQNLLGGHPYLVRRGLHEMASKKIDFTTLETEADKDDGIFGDHLRRILVLLAKDPDLTEILKGVTEGKPCPTPESFYRLRSAGIIHGDSQTECSTRCALYARFLKRHLAD